MKPKFHEPPTFQVFWVAPAGMTMANAAARAELELRTLAARYFASRVRTGDVERTRGEADTAAE